MDHINVFEIDSSSDYTYPIYTFAGTVLWAVRGCVLFREVPKNIYFNKKKHVDIDKSDRKK
jgi:hypothetical protein